MKKAIMFPGQGSQYRGMGKELFKKYRTETALASAILGYDIEELCVADPKRLLGKTAFTQPALYVVNALAYYNQQANGESDYLIGHSLGEYNALLAAGAFDFETGLKLVQKRGALMAAASGGGMAAVLGLSAVELKKHLADGGYTDIDIANYNTPTQFVLAAKEAAIDKVVIDFDSKGIKIIPLFVSAPFHSRYMASAAAEFATFLKGFTFSPLKIPVIANVTAKCYEDGQVAELLSQQIASSVQWTDTVKTLINKGVSSYEEIGGVILTKMVNEIKESVGSNFNTAEISEKLPTQKTITPTSTITDLPIKKMNGHLSTKLGSKTFREDFGLKYAYMSGAMYRGIASKELVVCMAKAGMLGFLGTGGMSLAEIENNIQYIQQQLKAGEMYGMNLLNSLTDTMLEMKTVELYLKYDVQNIEAAAYMQVSPALVYFRLSGLKKDKNNQIICGNRIVAKVSRPEVAENFMRPAPQKIVEKLLGEGLITAEQAAWAKNIPMSYDICVEADSGGHTDGGVALALLPSIQQLRATIENEYNYDKHIRVGLAGGIGTPQAIACAYVMGADFVVTGSINQCTVEAGTSDAVKDLLQEINVQDTDYAPAGDMFEIGSKVQVMKKGVLFPARANKLYALYSQYNSIEEIPTKTIEQLEKNYFKKPIETVWEETKNYLQRKNDQSEITKAMQNPKHKMALIFRWYFGHSSKLAFEGSIGEKVNFQIHTGPAMGSFNQWVKGTNLESWRNRHADKIGVLMMESAAQLLKETLVSINE